MAASELSQWLRKQLKQRDWVQSDLARALGVGNGTVSRWMNGQRPDTQYVERIADVLNSDVDFLLTLAGHRPETEPIDPDDPRAEFIAMIRRINFKDRPDWQQLIRSNLNMLIDWQWDRHTLELAAEQDESGQ